MRYVRLGSSGLKVSPIALGCMMWGSSNWQPFVGGEEAGRACIRAAIEHRINFFDTADSYSNGLSEEILGRAIKDFAVREEVVLASKVGRPMGEGPNRSGLSRKHILQAIDASLRRLGTDYLDLYIIHRFDDETPIEETLEALNDVVRAGKALYLGASAMLATQLATMLSLQRERHFARFVSMQNYYNLIYREEEREMLPLCTSEGIAVTPFSPLARGFLAGTASRDGARTRRAETDSVMRRRGIGVIEEDHVIAERVAEVAAERGVSRAAIALGWLLCKPAVTAPVLGISRPKQLDDAIAAVDLGLDAATVRYLEEPYRPKALSGLQAFGVR